MGRTVIHVRTDIQAMFGVSEENIIESERSDAYTEDYRDTIPEYEKDSSVKLTVNHTTPNVISDGVDVVEVGPVDEDRFVLDYHGYSVGYMVVNRDGVIEFGEQMLGGDEEIPSWLVDDNLKDRAFWIPDGFEPDASVECQRCRTETPVTEVKTPRAEIEEGVEFGRFCGDCWEEIGEDWLQNQRRSR